MFKPVECNVNYPHLHQAYNSWFISVFRQFISTVFLNNEKCRIKPVKTQQFIQFRDQLHVSTKHGHHQVGYRKEMTGIYE